MVVISPGSYVMGSTQEERTRLGVMPLFDKMETPRHRVAIAYRFAVGRFPITFEEWDAYASATGGYRPDDEGWGRGRRPVINVNWADTQGYLGWLGRQTGQTYRLLTEAEWEYAARGGTVGPYYGGREIAPEHANFGNHVGQTTEVGTYPANPFGLYDVTGNVAEWVQDRHHDSYDGAPADGSAWLTGSSPLRNVRGGAWCLQGWSVRTAQRIGDPPEMRNDHLGFRIARNLAT